MRYGNSYSLLSIISSIKRPDHCHHVIIMITTALVVETTLISLPLAGTYACINKFPYFKSLHNVAIPHSNNNNKIQIFIMRYGNSYSLLSMLSSIKRPDHCHHVIIMIITALVVETTLISLPLAASRMNENAQNDERLRV